MLGGGIDVLCYAAGVGQRTTAAQTCTSHAMHQHPGLSPRVIRRVHSNAPSEHDHPLFGLHDPERKVRLGKMSDTSITMDNYARPSTTSYVYRAADPPYKDTAHHCTTFDPLATMGRHVSEQQSKYSWPRWTVLEPTRKPKSALTRLE